MAWPTDLQIALKEWAVLCSALADGQQIILLRKGGIYESAGEFEIEHRQFLLFPTYLHQNAEMLKETFRAGLTPLSAEPGQVQISLAAEITDIIPMNDRPAMDRLSPRHIWSPKLIDMRFNYRPGNPLYLLLVRAYRLASPVMLQNTPAYAGCKSWIPLEQIIDTRNSSPVLSDTQYHQLRDAILSQLKSPPV